MITATVPGARAAGLIALACTTAFAALPAQAATVDGSLSVEATVTENCTLSTTAVSFPDVDSTSASNVDAVGAIEVTCTSGTGWSAAAGIGGGSGASFASRRMSAGGNLLNYNLYTNAGRTVVWGDGTGSTAAIASSGSGSSQNIAIYGRVPGGQNGVPAGDYADTVAVTVTY